jgi:AraC-like DNA-binding protein
MTPSHQVLRHFHTNFPLGEDRLTPLQRVKVSAASARPAGSANSPREFQDAFFRRVQPAQQLRRLFEYLPDVDFFAKDAEGRFTAVSSGTLRRVGAEREEDLLGKCDDAIHPPSVANAIREDDLHVMRTRQPLVDRVEALYARTRAKDWFLTTKVPLLDAAGEVIGIMGFVRPYRGTGAVADPQIDRVVTHIQEHFRERLVMPELARLAHLSERQLNRRFQETFRTSVQAFIVRTRVQAASDALLETDRSVAEIAHACGFYDQAAFSRHFRKHVGETPLAFRRRRNRPRASC